MAGVEEPPRPVGCPIVRRINGDGVELAVLDEGEGAAVLLHPRLPGFRGLVAASDPER